MNITKIEILNFRKIKNETFEFNDQVSILSGYNGLGKTTILNALTWLLSSTLVGDGDDVIDNKMMDSILPNDYVRGLDPQVSIWLGNVKFTKKYVTKYKRASDTISGRANEYYINDIICKNVDEFNDEINPRFNYTPTFTKLNVREVNLFTDPLYALLKLDYKELRKLLVAMGCSVGNEEIYSSNPDFEALRKYEADYLGKFDMMKSDYKKKILTLESQIKDNNSKLSLFASVNEFDSTELDKLTKEKEKLIIDRNALQNPNNEEINALKFELQKLKNEQENYFKSSNQELNLQIKNIGNQIEFDTEKIRQENKNAISEIKLSLGSKITDLNIYSSALENYEKTKKEALSKMERQKNNGINANTQIGILMNKLTAATSLKFDGNTTCPFCGKEHPISEEVLTKFEADKQEKIDFFKAAIEMANCQKETAKNEYFGCKNLVINCDKQIEEAIQKVTTLKNEADELNTQRKNLENAIEYEISKASGTNKEKVKELQNKIMNLSSTAENKVYQNKINDILDKINSIENNDQINIKVKVDEINLQISEVDLKIDEENRSKNSWLNKKPLVDLSVQLKKKLNDVNYIYLLVTDFVNELISKVNDKAKKLTGIDFVMLEDTLSDTVKDTCYAIYDGVKFENINSAKKIELGVKFIEKCKDIVFEKTGQRNTLPILVDDMEKISEISTIKELTKEQIICTRVSEEKEIKII